MTHYFLVSHGSTVDSGCRPVKTVFGPSRCAAVLPVSSEPELSRLTAGADSEPASEPTVTDSILRAGQWTVESEALPRVLSLATWSQAQLALVTVTGIMMKSGPGKDDHPSHTVTRDERADVHSVV